jgi:hypothetical protein
VTDLEEKVLLLKMRLKKYRKDFDHILKQSDLDKAILVLDDNPHLLRTNNGSQKKRGSSQKYLRQKVVYLKNMFVVLRTQRLEKKK